MGRPCIAHLWLHTRNSVGTPVCTACDTCTPYGTGAAEMVPCILSPLGSCRSVATTTGQVPEWTLIGFKCTASAQVHVHVATAYMGRGSLALQ